LREYALYLESGPRRQKTMVHVLDLLGCVAIGPTTEAAIEAAPDAIRAYLGFLRRHGERVNPNARFATRIAQHVTEGQWLGNGSPSVVFAPDLEPLDAKEIERLLARFRWLREELAGWAASCTERQLDAAPRAGGGRTARAILLHVLGAPVGGYLASALGSSKGFSRLHAEAARGEVPIPDALMRIEAMAAERIRATTPEERAAVRQRPHGVSTLRRAMRRILEHDWEHLAELSRRPGGPPV
jgi:predicted RNase H-like HicB family nuclease